MTNTATRLAASLVIVTAFACAGSLAWAEGPSVPVVTSADSRFTLRLTGQVNRQAYVVIDGNRATFLQSDSNQSPTRIRLDGRAQVSEGFTVGATIAIALQANRPLLVSQNEPRVPFTTTPRHLELWFNGVFGRFSLGFGMAAAFFVHEYDLSGTQPIALLSVGNLAGGLLFSDGTGYPGVRVRDIFVDIEALNFVNRIRYDTPWLFGLRLSGSYGDDQRWDVALRGRWGLGDSVNLRLVGSYQQRSLGRFDWRADGGLSILHRGTGLNLTGGAAWIEPGSGSELYTQRFNGFVVKLGWRYGLFDVGETRFSVDHARNFDVGAEGEEGQSWGAFMLQRLDDWGVTCSVGYRFYKLDRPGSHFQPLHVPVLQAMFAF